MRIITLLPSATEIAFALGLEDEIVGVTHECDYPAAAKSKPVLIESALGDTSKLSPKEIDSRLRELLKSGESAYRFKEGAFTAAKPDLIITQGLCDVCAVPKHFVIQEIRKAKIEPQILSLDPEDLTGILTDIRRVGEITGKVDKAGEIVDALEERVGEVAGRTRDLPTAKRPSVAVIEWIDPIYFAGHWVPEMIDLAGGRDALAKPGERSRAIEWKELLDAAPEIIIVAPCGFDVNGARKQASELKSRAGWSELPAVKSNRVYLMDANATLSRPGPRIVDGLEDLAQIIQPELFPVRGKARWERL
ncbi:MAG TPA: cobalamin-binding protein [Planctomycetota bacterium]|nr:cobalamin-binding protein [Planctomycetota bacterium]